MAHGPAHAVDRTRRERRTCRRALLPEPRGFDRGGHLAREEETMSTSRTWSALASTLFLLTVVATGCSGKSEETAPTSLYSIGGTITWLTVSDGLVLGTAGQPDLSVSNGQASFNFANRVPSGASYDVTIATQPVPGGCAIAHGSGIVTGADVTDIAVTCDGRLVSGALNVARGFYFTATALPSGKVLVAGGHTSGTGAPVTRTAELFDPRTGRWTMAASMTVPRASACAALLSSGKILVAGGAGTVGNTAEVYDPATDTWTPTAQPMAAGHDLAACVVLDSGKVLIAGGLNQVNTSSNAVSELYDPSTGLFTPTGSMATPRYWHTATLLWSGKVLVTAGCTDGYPCTTTTATAELYDPASGTWSSTGSLPAGVFGHTASLFSLGLADVADVVLVVGGCKSDALCGPEGPHSGSAEASASLYYPKTGEFQPFGAMTTGRVGHAVAWADQGFRFIGGTYEAGLGATTDVYGWDGTNWAWKVGAQTAFDHGSYLGAAGAWTPTGMLCACGYWLAIGGLGPWTGTYLFTPAVEGAWIGCGC